MKFVTVLSLLFSLVIGFVVSIPTGTFNTNAERFARGLPPAPPRFARGLQGTVDYGNFEKRWGGGPEPSSRPYSGKIQVTDTSNGHVLGYVKKSYTDNGLYTLTQSRDDALVVNFNSRPNQVTTLKASNNPDSTFPFLAFIIPGFNFNTGTLKSGSADYVFLGGAKSATSPNSTPAAVGNSHTNADIADNGVETAIWKYSASSGSSLTPSWVNSDGGDASVTAFYSEGGFFGLTGDVNEYKKFADSQIHTVKFTLV